MTAQKHEPVRAGARPAPRRLRSLAASGLIVPPKLKIKSLLGTPGSGISPRAFTSSANARCMNSFSNWSTTPICTTRWSYTRGFPRSPSS